MQKLLLLLCFSCLGMAAMAQLKQQDYGANIIQLNKKLTSLSEPSFTMSALSKRWNEGIKIFADGTQTALSNWAAGGLSSVALRVSLEAFTSYQKGYIVWKNNFATGYGFIKQNGTPFAQKTDDRIELVSTFGYTLNPYHSLTGMLTFRTQYANGYSSAKEDRQKISSFLAPGYTILSAGWTFHPTEIFNVFAAPFSGRFTFVKDPFLSEKEAFGVKSGEKLRSELGFFLRLIFEKSRFTLAFAKNVSIKTAFEIYANYLRSENRIALNFENSMTFKVNDYINGVFSFYMIFDEAIRFPTQFPDGTVKDIAKVQLKEILGFGFVYDFLGILKRRTKKLK